MVAGYRSCRLRVIQYKSSARRLPTAGTPHAVLARRATRTGALVHRTVASPRCQRSADRLAGRVTAHIHDLPRLIPHHTHELGADQLVVRGVGVSATCSDVWLAMAESPSCATSAVQTNETGLAFEFKQECDTGVALWNPSSRELCVGLARTRTPWAGESSCARHVQRWLAVPRVGVA